MLYKYRKRTRNVWKCFYFYFIPVFSSFFASYDAMNEYRWGRDVARKLLIVDGNDNFRRLPSPLVNGKLPLRNLKYTCAKIL